MRGALWLLREHEGAVEADLQRYYGVDYRDRWRRDCDGSRRLTVRRIWVLAGHLPPDSSMMDALRGGEMHWPLEAHLLDELRMTFEQAHREKGAAKPHPARPKAKPRRTRDTPERQLKLRRARQRAADRRRRREAGEL